jgi:hypothetical protein
MARSTVDLPPPDGPNRAVTDPDGALNSIDIGKGAA